LASSAHNLKQKVWVVSKRVGLKKAKNTKHSEIKGIFLSALQSLILHNVTTMHYDTRRL